MKAKILTLTTAAVTAATPALAAGRQDTSGLFVWAFLGFCALIVAAQVVPAILMMVGAARGVAKTIHETQGEEAKAEIEIR
ncbi:MAG: hypothetical protein SCH98_17890 [Deferrisomatales bacterium]|nr:hypothetical protein [Deferrisomatales bacterium]